MSLLDSSRLLHLALFSVWLLAGRASADDSVAAVRTNSQVIAVASRNEEVIGNEPVRRAYLTHGTNEFAFVVPQEFRLDATNPEKVLLVKSDYSCYFTFRLIGPAPALAQELKPETYRELALDQHPGATIMDESSATAAGHSGPAFELQWKPPGTTAQRARLAFIPSAAGVMEFRVVAGTNKFTEARHAFNFVLLNFRSNEGGKLKIARFSDKS
jgi:hypothetical protein